MRPSASNEAAQCFVLRILAISTDGQYSMGTRAQASEIETFRRKLRICGSLVTFRSLFSAFSALSAVRFHSLSIARPYVTARSARWRG
jgi:hypothetical protein